MELDDAVSELYGTSPEGFLALRKELEARARAARDRDTARAITTLRRPTIAAWLVNLVVRDEDGARALRDLAALGDALRQAQSGLDADRLRELGRERRTRVADVVSLAVELGEAAGENVSAAVEHEVDETLVAAVADPAAAEAVRSGALTRALSYSGFGEVDLDAAVAVLRPLDAKQDASATMRATTPEPDADAAVTDEATARPAEDETDARRAEHEAAARHAEHEAAARRAEHEARVAAAEQALADAEAAASAAAAALREAAQRERDARDAAQRDEERVGDLERDLADARRLAEASGEAATTAEQDLTRAEEAARAAAADLDRRRMGLESLPPPA